MKQFYKGAIIISLLLIALGSQAQINLFTEDINWEDYEIEVAPDAKKAIVKQCINSSDHLRDASGLIEEALDNFHILDYNYDHRLDVFYSGWGYYEGEITFIFELNRQGKYENTFIDSGELIHIDHNGIGTPFSFILRNTECCAGIMVHYTSYSYVAVEGKSQFKSSMISSCVSTTEMPKKTFIHPIQVEVENYQYHLRHTPEIINEPKYEEHDIKGNIIATHPEGTRGFAIAEKSDATGRVWYFVIIPYDKSNGVFSYSQYIKAPQYQMGWMSSRYLRKM